MIGIVETITSLLGISRDARDGNKRKKREVVFKREKKDMVTISEEARNLVADASSGNRNEERKNGAGR